MRTLAVVILLLGSLPAVFGAVWEMDPRASRIGFVASYQGEPVPGEFHRVNASLVFDPDRPEQGELHVRVDITSADMGSEELNEGIRTAEWLDTDRYPTAEFHSSRIRRVDERHFSAEGPLRLKGVKRDIRVPFVFAFKAEEQAAVMSGEVQMQRTWFDIGTGEWATDDPISTTVLVTFTVKWNHAD